MTWTSTSVPYFTPPEPGQPDPWTASGGTQRLLAAEVVKAPRDVREALRLPEGARVVRRSRLIIDAGEPMEIATSYWPADWAENTGLAEMRPVRGGTVRLAADLGWVAATALEEASAVLASEADVPEAPADAALFVLKRTLLTAGGVPFEYIVMHRWNRDPQRYVLKAT
jgi:GntR family transcriptional regulator